MWSHGDENKGNDSPNWKWNALKKKQTLASIRESWVIAIGSHDAHKTMIEQLELLLAVEVTLESN